jgi:hypothetical protein
MKTLNLLILLLCSSLLFSCATNRKSHEKLRKLVKAQKLDEAEKFVKSEKFFPEKESQLLKLLETGMVQHLNGNYYQSLQSFDKAKELSDKLYTVSISKKIKSALINSNTDNYYGEKYERSMIRFYQVLNHYALFYNGKYEKYDVFQKDGEGKKLQKKTIPAKDLSAKEKKFHLTAAKNVLLEWNSLLDNYKSISGGEVTYKDDLLAKVFGAFIHEQMGTRHDNRVALNLYKEAKKVLFRNFNMLETYNGKSEKFKSDFKKLPNMGKKKVELNYVEKTKFYSELEQYLNDRIKALKSGKKSNVFVLIENDFITPKSFKKFDFPIPTEAIPTTVSNTQGFMGFAGRVLKASAGTIPKIYFEMPEVPYRPVTGSPTVVVKQDGKVVAQKKFAVVNPLSNLATMTLNEDVMGIYTKVGARVATKHVVALATAYLIYEQNKDKGDFLAMTLATVSYAGANKAIEMSERADLRNWSLLPHNFRLTSLNLAKGNYEIFIKKVVGQKEVEQSLGKVTVDGKKTSLLKFRTY